MVRNADLVSHPSSMRNAACVSHQTHWCGVAFGEKCRLNFAPNLYAKRTRISHQKPLGLGRRSSVGEAFGAKRRPISYQIDMRNAL